MFAKLTAKLKDRHAVKKFHVQWRHATMDTPTYPYGGGGVAYGVTEAEALDAFFRPNTGSTSDPVTLDHLHRREQAWRSGQIEILSITRVA